MTLIDLATFSREYRRAVEDVLPFVTPDAQEVIGRHNVALRPGQTDLSIYLRYSEIRYARTMALVNRHARVAREELELLDVGGFLGAFPLALARMGIPATLVEEYDYYYGAFDGLKAYLEAEGLTIWAADFTKPLDPPPDRRWTLVANMAMIEHLPDSPKVHMDNLRSVTDPRGLFVLDTPNVGYWPKRLEVLRGGSTHPPLKVIYDSAPPFLGHHHEYTVAEVGELLEWSGFRVEELDAFNYSLSVRDGAWSDRIYTALVYLWPTLLFKGCREVILACASPR
jgi:2-polyprenyl-3-methyl-5-hydroxy-6-metoxy-1,4-benzoquinol methylase